MKTYKVTVYPQAQTYFIETTNEDLAKDKAMEYIHEEDMYYLLKWAEIEVEEEASND